MYTLQLIDANDNVGQSSAVLKDEDRAIAAGIGISITGPATVVLLVSHVFRARDNTGGRKRDDGSNSRGDVQCLASGKSDRGTDDSDFETHFE